MKNIIIVKTNERKLKIACEYYKGYAFHKSVGASNLYTVTCTKGNKKGIAVCRYLQKEECKDVIDKIVETFGERELIDDDIKTLRTILDDYVIKIETDKGQHFEVI
jgi:hypothetical protein